jgi:uncharacterized protein (DUF305 family)
MRTALPSLALVASLAACSGATASGTGATPEPAAPAATQPARQPHNEADAAFMTDMIGHHAQAIVISRWAATHGASSAVQRLADRIIVGQEDEIVMMQRWLRDHGEPVPEPDTAQTGRTGMDHSMHMPGMLSSEELAALDAARGAAFDRMFLTLMIRHHEGALTMVERLFASPGAGEDDTVFRIASDVQADQRVEIRRMQSMIDALGS